MPVQSLTSRFALTLLLSTAVPILAFAWFVRGELRDRAERDWLDPLLASASEQLTSKLSQVLDGYRAELFELSLPASLALAPGTLEAQDSFRLEVENLHDADSSSYHALALVDGEGNVVDVIPSLDPKSVASRSPDWPDSVADQEWFRMAVAEGSHWVDRHLPPFLHGAAVVESRDPTDYALGVALSISLESGGDPGVLYALVRWDRIQEVVDDEARFLAGVDALRYPGATAFLADRSGIAIAHSDRAAFNLPLPNLTSDAVDVGLLQSVIDVDAPGVGFRWRAGVAAPARELFASTEKFGGILFVVSLVLAIALLVWSVLASRAVSRPVHELVEATGRIAHGDLAARVHSRGPRELAELGQAFNSMAEDLEENRKRLREAERDAAWAEMARQVAHEIKNPLTPMRMTAQMLLKAKREESERLGEMIDRTGRAVMEQTDALAKIAADFRHFAGSPQRNVERTPLHEIVEGVERQFAGMVDAGQIRLEASFEGCRDLLVHVDRLEISRVFINLVQNAYEAGEEGVSITLGFRVDGDELRCSVVDTGPGVDDEFRGRLFEPYFTTRSSGTGLGLAICRRTVEHHGGRIWLAESGPGRTEFVFTLPMAESPSS